MILFRFLLFTFLLGATQLSTAQDTADNAESIKWYTWEEAQEMAATNPKKVFVDLYTNWCGWCKRMDATTFQDPEVIKYLNENFYPVKFNAEQKETVMFNDREFTYYVEEGKKKGVHLLAYALLDGRLGYPAFVTLDETYARIMISPGYKKVPQLIEELTFANDEKYKEMSWEDFQKGE